MVWPYQLKVYPALNQYQEKPEEKQGKRRIICPQSHIALPAEGVESEDRYLHNAEQSSAYEK